MVVSILTQQGVALQYNRWFIYDEYMGRGSESDGCGVRGV